MSVVATRRDSTIKSSMLPCVSLASAATDAVVSGYLPDVAYSETDATYRTVAIASTNGVKGHQIVLNGSAYTATKDHLLVDKQDFNCPISYKFAGGKRMWYQRMPDHYVNLTEGWEAVSLPFTAELVSTQDKGEITHFYSGSLNVDENGTKIGHEYWLREYSCGIPIIIRMNGRMLTQTSTRPIINQVVAMSDIPCWQLLSPISSASLARPTMSSTSVVSGLLRIRQRQPLPSSTSRPSASSLCRELPLASAMTS